MTDENVHRVKEPAEVVKLLHGGQPVSIEYVPSPCAVVFVSLSRLPDGKLEEGLSDGSIKPGDEYHIAGRAVGVGIGFPGEAIELYGIPKGSKYVLQARAASTTLCLPVRNNEAHLTDRGFAIPLDGMPELGEIEFKEF